MKITSINVRRIEKEGSRMKGIASIVLDDSFAVHDIRIIEGDKGLFIAMPSKQVRNTPGLYKDIAHPITSEVRTVFEDAILEAYKNADLITNETEEKEAEEEE
jgi:stage V sporulation protein G